MVKLRRLVKLVIWGLVGAAVVQELRTPPEKRTWHGTVGGVVPYDFRPPSPEKVRRAWWDPTGPLITPNAFGVGWAINLARLLQMLNVNILSARYGAAPGPCSAADRPGRSHASI